MIAGPTETVKMIAPTGVKEGYSINAGGIVRIEPEIRATIRSFATKMPQFYYSAFPQIGNMPTYISSYDDFMLTIRTNIWTPNELGEEVHYETWLNNTKDYDWVDGIPKNKLFVRLADGLSRDRMEFIMNGIRNNLDRADLTLTKLDVVEALDALTVVLNIFVAIVAVIALFITFFLLLISMT